MITDTKANFISLVKAGIGHECGCLPERMNWEAVKTLADEHGLTAVVLDALSNDFTGTIPTQLKLEWIGEVLANFEQRYVQYEKAISSLAGFYNRHGFKMMVLKGYACALDWPKPEHRPCGDIDIWQFGQWREADAALSKDKSIRIDSSHHHHTVFEWNGFSVENHYDFVNVHAHKSSKELEVIFKELGQDDSCHVDVDGEMVYLPSTNLHALFLIKHMVSHFAAVNITLRQVLDWAFFVEKHTKEINWKWLSELLEKYHMLEFFNCINAICVGDLGFNVKLFPEVKFLTEIKERVLEDILSPEYTTSAHHGFMKRMVYKYQRWQGNAWKQKICYGESRWTMFWRGVWNHLLKPSSI